MKKGIILAFILSLLASSAMAAPLDDYSKAGNVGFSIYIIRSDMEDDRNGDGFHRVYSYGDKWSWGGELTISFAPKWAVSFDYAQHKNKDKHFFSNIDRDDSMSSKLKSSNIKLKYQAYKNERLFVAPYLGIAVNKLKQSHTSDWTRSGLGVVNFNFETKRKNSLLAGVTLVYGVDKESKFKTYFDAAVGSKVYSWNLGISYEVAKNLDMDFGYRYYKAKGMGYHYPDTGVGALVFLGDHGKIDSTSKGIYFGLSYKFT